MNQIENLGEDEATVCHSSNTAPPVPKNSHPSHQISSACL
jgi:hypothetical protein